MSGEDIASIIVLAPLVCALWAGVWIGVWEFWKSVR